MNGLKVTRIELTEDACFDVMTTAVEAGYTNGIGYWADVDTNRSGSRVVSMLVKDREDTGRIHKVNQNVVRKAIAAILGNQKETGGEYCARMILAHDHLDGPAADVVIQVACFGKVKYA